MGWKFSGVCKFAHKHIHEQTLYKLPKKNCSEPSIVPLIFELKQNENKGVGLCWDLLKLVKFVVWYSVERYYSRIFFINSKVGLLLSDIFRISDFFWKLGGGIIIEHGTILGSLWYTSGPRYWNVPVSVSTGTFLVYQYCPKMWYLRSLERAGAIQKLTTLERINGLVLSNTCVPVSGTYNVSILFPILLSQIHMMEFRMWGEPTRIMLLWLARYKSQMQTNAIVLTKCKFIAKSTNGPPIKNSPTLWHNSHHFKSTSSKRIFNFYIRRITFWRVFASKVEVWDALESMNFMQNLLTNCVKFITPLWF